VLVKEPLGAIAESYRDPYAAFSKARSAEDVFKRQLKLSGATQAMASDEALEIARLKAQGEERFQKDYSPDRMYYEAYSKYTDPKSKDAFKKILQQIIQNLLLVL
jgi:hypothetical protein